MERKGEETGGKGRRGERGREGVGEEEAEEGRGAGNIR